MGHHTEKIQLQITKSCHKRLLLQLIQDHFERSHPEGKPKLNKDAYLFVNRWKENTKASQILYDWSNELEKDLNKAGQILFH